MYSHSSRQCSACGDVTRVLVASYNLNQTGSLNGRVSSDLTPREVRETLCRMSLSGTWAGCKRKAQEVQQEFIVLLRMVLSLGHE